jgi:hypothetical protein
MKDVNLISNITKTTQEIQSKLLEFLPNILTALAVVMIGYVVAKILKALIHKLISRADKFVKIPAVVSALQRVGYRKSASEVTSKVVFWIVFIFSLTIATEVMGLQVVTTWLGGLNTYLPQLLAAVLIGLVGVVFANVVKEFIVKTATTAGITYSTLLGNIFQIGIIIVTIVVVIGQIGIETQFLSLITMILLGSLLGGASLAFGMGSRDIVSNILSSYYLQKKYEVGQKVKISNTEGLIKEITTTSVLLEVPEGRMMIPARKFIDDCSTLVQN